MKYAITKEEFDALDESQQALYGESGEGYKLNIEGLPEPEDLSGLKAQVQRLMDEKKEASRRAKQAEHEQAERERQAAKEKGDFEQLYQSAQEQLEQSQKQYNDLVASNNADRVKSEAYKIASGIADGVNAEILSEFIERRLKVSEGQVRVLNDQGELTVSPIDTLAQEFKSNPRYASLVRGSLASGGGAAGAGSGAPNSKKAAEMTGSERAQLLNADPAKFHELFGTQGA